MKHIRLPLFWKFTIAIIVIVALFGSVNAVLIWRSVYAALDAEIGKHGEFIARSLASQAAAPLVYDDVATLQKLVDDISKTDPSVNYAFILDGSGKVLAHTFESTVPRALIRVNMQHDDENLSTILIAPRHNAAELIRDIALPVLDRSVGIIRIGIEQTAIQSVVEKTIHVLLIMVGVFLVAGIGGAFVFAHIITKPIQLISSAAESVDLDSLQQNAGALIRFRKRGIRRWEFPIHANDEIDSLGTTFNGMVERLRQAYIELTRAQASLLQSEKLASIGTLAAGIAHEVNNPIAGLQNCIRRITKDPSNIAQNMKYLKLMNEATENIEQVIQRLLNFSRKHELIFEHLHVTLLLENVLILIGHRLDVHSIHVKKSFPSHISQVRGSRNHLEQVFLNLLLNSIDAIEAAQHTLQRKTGTIFLGIAQKNDRVEISITDNGIGIREKHLEKIFDPFFTTKEIGKGTGLGLAVSYHIIQEHNGDIQVKSTFGEGTTFTIQLPIM